MAKIRFAKVTDETVRFYTLNRPFIGQKVLFLDDKTAGDILTIYDDSTDSESRKWANGIKCIVASDTILRPHIIPVNDFTARSTILIENSRTPQLRHKVTERIASLGVSELQTLGAGKKVASVGGTYEILVKSRNRDEPYSWTTLGLDETDETYQIKDGKIVFGELSITIEECLKHFADVVERQNKQLNPPQTQTAK